MKHISLVALAATGALALPGTSAESFAHDTSGSLPPDPNVCHMLMAGDDVLGEYSTVGDELDDEELDGVDLVGAARQIVRAAAKRGRKKPRWRSEAAPGVPFPDYGLFPVPLTPLTNNGIFSASVANIIYSTTVQVPFRGERPVVDIGRFNNGGNATAVQVLAQNGVFIGTRPQVGVLGSINLANYQRDSFGVRLVMQPAGRGTEIKLFVFTNPVLTGTDEIAVSIEILGRVAS